MEKMLMLFIKKDSDIWNVFKALYSECTRNWGRKTQLEIEDDWVLNFRLCLNKVLVIGISPERPGLPFRCTATDIVAEVLKRVNMRRVALRILAELEEGEEV